MNGLNNPNSNLLQNHGFESDLPACCGHSPDVCSDRDVYIPVMGMTGAGKSTFIKQCVQTSAPHVGHGLLSGECKVLTCQRP